MRSRSNGLLDDRKIGVMSSFLDRMKDKSKAFHMIKNEICYSTIQLNRGLIDFAAISQYRRYAQKSRFAFFCRLTYRISSPAEFLSLKTSYQHRTRLDLIYDSKISKIQKLAKFEGVLRCRRHRKTADKFGQFLNFRNFTETPLLDGSTENSGLYFVTSRKNILLRNLGILCVENVLLGLVKKVRFRHKKSRNFLAK